MRQLRHALCVGTAAVTLSGGAVLLTGGAALADGCTGLVGCLGQDVGDTLGAVGDGDLAGALGGVGDTVGHTVDGVGKTVDGTVDGVHEAIHDTAGAAGKGDTAPQDPAPGGVDSGDQTGGSSAGGTVGDDGGHVHTAGGQGTDQPSGAGTHTVTAPHQHGPSAPTQHAHQHRGHVGDGQHTRLGSGLARLGLQQWLGHSLPSGLGGPYRSSPPPLPDVSRPPLVAARPARHVPAPEVATAGVSDGTSYLAALAAGEQPSAVGAGGPGGTVPAPAVLLATVLAGGTGVAYLSVYRRRRSAPA